MSLLRNPRVVTALSLGLLVVGLVVDLNTTQELVIAIIYNIPIALSSLALSRRLTLSVLLLSIGANIAAGYDNGLAHNGLALTVLFNRTLATLSFLLVGVLTLALRDAASRVVALELGERRADHNEALRRTVNALNRALYPEALLQTAARSFQALLDAEEVVICAVTDGAFKLPRYSSPSNAGVAQAGTSARWALEALPFKVPVTCLRQSAGLTAIARLERSTKHDLILVAVNPRVAAPKQLLTEAVASLEGLLLRADELERLALAQQP